jgi:hypothetical protein
MTATAKTTARKAPAKAPAAKATKATPAKTTTKKAPAKMAEVVPPAKGTARPPAPGKPERINHADCDHERTPAGRALCRAARKLAAQG